MGGAAGTRLGAGGAERFMATGPGLEDNAHQVKPSRAARKAAVAGQMIRWFICQFSQDWPAGKALFFGWQTVPNSVLKITPNTVALFDIQPSP